LRQESVVAKFATTAADGKTYQVEYFNLDVIISVGYRVKSHRGTQFRIWATQRLREYIIKGFSLDDERFKQAGGSQVDPHGSFAVVHVAVSETDPKVKPYGDEVRDGHGEPHGLAAELFRLLKRQAGELRADAEIPVILVHENHELSGLTAGIHNQGRMADDLVVLPRQDVDGYVQQRRYPPPARFGLGWGKPLGSGPGQENLVHVHETREIMARTGSNLE